MFYRQILHEQRACISYVIGCPSRGVMAVVDPQGDPERYQKITEEHGMHITHILETHIHADHLSGAQALQALSGAPTYQGPGSTVGYEVISLSDGQVLPVGNRQHPVSPAAQTLGFLHAGCFG